MCLTPFQSHVEPQAIVLLVYLHVFSLKNFSIKALAKAFCVLNHYGYFSLYPALPKKMYHGNHQNTKATAIFFKHIACLLNSISSLCLMSVVANTTIPQFYCSKNNYSCFW